jgi:hypothetical protein
MRFTYIHVDMRWPVYCSVCGRLLPDDTISCGDILYCPRFSESDDWQPDAIEALWGVDPYADFGICESCIQGHCGAVPDLTPDDWLRKHLKEEV